MAAKGLAASSTAVVLALLLAAARASTCNAFWCDENDMTYRIRLYAPVVWPTGLSLPTEILDGIVADYVDNSNVTPTKVTTFPKPTCYFGMIKIHYSNLDDKIGGWTEYYQLPEGADPCQFNEFIRCNGPHGHYTPYCNPQHPADMVLIELNQRILANDPWLLAHHLAHEFGHTFGMDHRTGWSQGSACFLRCKSVMCGDFCFTLRNYLFGCSDRLTTVDTNQMNRLWPW